MKITWYGHACFRLEGDGLSIVTDPYQVPTFGFRAMTDPADIVIRSSPDDIAHSARETVPGRHDLVEAIEVARSGPITVRGVRFEAFRTRERLLAGKPHPGDNAMYRFTVEGIRILHTGDIGIPFQPDHLDLLRGQIDVMLAITGDNYTIALDDLAWAIEEIRPRVVIPMHYQVDTLRLPRGSWMYPLEAFTNRYPEDVVVRTNASHRVFSRASLPDAFRIHVLEPAGSSGHDPR
jgi:L-ascorbate metabolism protein UlaG (beta-lactamase superfamily)